MIKDFLRRIFEPTVKLHSYSKPDGSFDYEAYCQAQESANLRKLDQVWAKEENIALLAQYIREKIPHRSFGICHGTRRGLEQQWFQKYLGCDVIGTEISSSATQFPHTVQWDFHEINDEWLGKADFIYSNSLDHAYDPMKALNSWMQCLAPHGICILEHSRGHSPSKVNATDPFGAKLSVMPSLISEWGNGRFSVSDMFPGVSKRNRQSMMYLMIMHVASRQE
jgi:hypothetical protein